MIGGKHSHYFAMCFIVTLSQEYKAPSPLGLVLADLGWMCTDLEILFQPEYLQCGASLLISFSPFEIGFGMLGMVISVLPMLIILITNIIILIIVAQTSKARGRRHAIPSKKAVITISLVCWVYIISYIPTAVQISLLSPHHPPSTWLSLFATYTFSLNIIANPFIYTLTNNRFNRFMKQMFMLGYSNRGVVSDVVIMQNSYASHNQLHDRSVVMESSVVCIGGRLSVGEKRNCSVSVDRGRKFSAASMGERKVSGISMGYSQSMAKPQSTVKKQSLVKSITPSVTDSTVL